MIIHTSSSKSTEPLTGDCGNILMVIPARGGSKRLPRKNLLSLGGQPLIVWTIEVALAVGFDARILVTSDDEEILKVAKDYEQQGIVIHKRPKALATDTASTSDVLVDAIKTECREGYPPDTLILLQPTSPLRDVSDILSAIKVFKENRCGDTVVSVCRVDHPTAWIGVIGDRLQFTGVELSGKRSQDYADEYRLNGAVYVADVARLMSSGTLFSTRLRASIMPRERSFDIDDAIDFRICEGLIGG